MDLFDYIDHIAPGVEVSRYDRLLGLSRPLAVYRAIFRVFECSWQMRWACSAGSAVVLNQRGTGARRCMLGLVRRRR